jgi:hypothetical protein
MKRKKSSKIKYSPEDIWKVINQIVKPKGWREGQFVFNVIEDYFGAVAREVQFKDRVDCFHDDKQIDNFIQKVCNRLSK